MKAVTAAFMTWLGAALFAVGLLHASELSAPVVDVAPAVVVVPHWAVSTRDLRDQLTALGVRPEPGQNGFAVLKRQGETWVCHVWALKPTTWNGDDRAAVLGHEMMHCFGYDHD